MGKVQVQIVGLSEVKSSEEIYWLLFKEVNGDRHAPILIGKAEAQAITISLRRMAFPVKLTHQLFAEIAQEFDIILNDVYIFDGDEKPFTAKLTWNNGLRNYITDARASDGVALALCYGRPIYMDDAIFEKVETLVAQNTADTTPNELTEDELRTQLQQAVATENYEQAAIIRDELNKRNK
ncbi:MAG: bifunctional nuclease domain-containing protein [Paludibacteraceae bacterium]